MQVNIISNSQEGLDLLTFIEISKSHALNVNYEDPQDWERIHDFTENEYGWTSWLNFFSFSSTNLYEEDFDEGLSTKILKTNYFEVETFLATNQISNYSDFQKLFYNKTESGEHATFTIRERIAQMQQSNIAGNCFGVSLDFRYFKDHLDNLNVDHQVFIQSYTQLKVFYSAFKEKYNPKLLYLFPHIDPQAYDAREELEGRSYSGWDNDDGYEDGWSQAGREEERRMDEETDGFWRWNID